MELHELTKINNKGKRRLGQGHGSGRVKTGGRGYKGQKARNTVPLYFEGGAISLIKRLPFRRGKGRNNPLHPSPVVLNLRQLNSLPKNTEVTIESLIQHKFVDSREVEACGVKILAAGDLQVSLTVKVPVSRQAEEKIVKAGGSVESNSTSVSVSA